MPLPLRLSLIGCALALLLPVLAGPVDLAQAMQETSVAVRPGTLAGGALTFGEFPGVRLDAAQGRATTTWRIAPVVDARGTGAGWDLWLTLSPLREYDLVADGFVPGGRVLPPGMLTVTAPPAVALLDPSSSPAASVTAVAAGTPLDTGHPVALLTASPGGGMGSYTFGDLAVLVDIPASTSARAYAAEALVSLTTTP